MATDYISAMVGGSGYSSITGSNVYAYSGNKVASSGNLKRVSSDLSSGYSQDIEDISNCFEEGNTAEALRLYKELFENAKHTVEEYDYDLTDAQIRSRINDAYKSATGLSLSDEISANTNSSFWTGFLENLTPLGWILNDGISSADGRAAIRGKSLPGLKDVVSEVAGATVSGALSVAALGALTTITAGGTAIAGIGVVGGAVGAIAAGAAGVLAGGFLPVVGVGLALGAAVVGIKHLLSK